MEKMKAVSCDFDASSISVDLAQKRIAESVVSLSQTQNPQCHRGLVSSAE